MQPPSTPEGGGSGKPLSPPLNVIAEKVREIAAIEGAMIELTQLARAIEARTKQLGERADALAKEVKQLRNTPRLVVTNHLPPTPPLS